MAKQQKGSEKYSSARSSEAGQESDCRSNANRCQIGRRHDVRRGAAPKNQAHRRKKQHQAKQDSQNRNRRVQITPEISRREGQHGKRPEKFTSKKAGARKLKRRER